MEDEATKEEQATTSKKVSQRDGHDEGSSYSQTSVSGTYSAVSQVEIVEARRKPLKLKLGKRAAKTPERKKRVRRSGRVEKRRRSCGRLVRKAPIRKRQGGGGTRHARAEERLRAFSVSTIFSGLSTRSGSRTLGCVRCGHRCCRRRYQYEALRRRFTCRRCGRMLYRWIPSKWFVGAKRLKKKPGIKKIRRPFVPAICCKEIQTGSRSNMLSPLFINTNSTPEKEMTLPPQGHSEVTPEMIFESLNVLSTWREEVQTIMLFEHLRRNYPVNSSDRELFVELLEKLRIASIVGIVTQTQEDFWALAGELEQRMLTPNHVTLFWQAYTDTLRPIPRREPNFQKERSLLPTKTTRGANGEGQSKQIVDDATIPKS